MRAYRGSDDVRRQKLKVGDRITFRAVTRDSDRTVTRKVTGFWITGEPEVRYAGYSNFIVHWREISAVERSEAEG